MKGLIQRVSQAQVSIEGQVVGQIDEGLLLLLGVEKEDTPALAEKLLAKVLAYRVFEDDQGKMNRSLQEVQGGLLVVSQFTLVADTRKGLRPSFSQGAAPDHGRQMYEHFLVLAQKSLEKVESGRFGAEMKVSLTNEGPVTFLLEVN